MTGVQTVLFRSLVLNSLIVSKLTFNVHVWSNLNTDAWRCLNSTYMRVARRILGKPRFDHICPSDLQVRTQLGCPSLDCVLRRKRLIYLGWVAPVLHALLQSRSPLGTPPPWVRLIVDDLDVLFHHEYSELCCWHR